MVAFLLALTTFAPVHAGCLLPSLAAVMDWGNWGHKTEPTFPADSSCLDALEWCHDANNFMAWNCGSLYTPAPTSSNFDPTTCQSLYTMLDQNNCILQAFRSTNAPCAGIPVPEYNEHALNVLEASVACERFSKEEMECVTKFAKVNPTLDEVKDAVACVVEAAGLHDYIHDADAQDAQACLKYPDIVAHNWSPSTKDDECVKAWAGAGLAVDACKEGMSLPVAGDTINCQICETSYAAAVDGKLCVAKATSCDDLPSRTRTQTARPTLSGRVKAPTARPTLSGMVFKQNTAKCGCVCPGASICLTVYDCTPAEREAQLAKCPKKFGVPTTAHGSDADDKIPFIPMAKKTNDEPTARPTLSGMVLEQKTAKCGCVCPGASICLALYDCTPAERDAQLARCPKKFGSSTTHGSDADDKIPFIPMATASDPTCSDVLEWCEDPHNFMVKDCPNFSTAKDFDPATCQNLNLMIGQNDCIVRAFRSPASSDDPCSTVQLPYGDYNEATLDMMVALVSCENFSFANGLCLDEFSKLNPTAEDNIRAFKCIFNAAKQPKFASDDDAKACLKFRGH